MKDQAKTKPTAAVEQQLIDELAGLRRRVAELEAVETERKQAEEALRGALAELTVIQQNVPIAMMLVDRDRRVHKVNESATLFAGRPGEEMLGLRSGEALRCLHHLDDPRGCGFGPACATCAVRLAVLDTFATHRSRRDVEARMLFPRGDSVEERYLLVSTAYLQMDDTERVLVCAQDITDYKRAEEALREGGTRYQAIVEAFDGLIYVCSQDYRVEFMNKQLLERTGYDGTGELCYKALHDRDSICPWCVNDRVFAGETVRWEVQSPKDNRWYYVVNTPIYHTDGSMSKQAMILDITERKQAEQKLLKERTLLKAIIDNIPVLLVHYDPGADMLYLNREFEKTVGWRTEEVKDIDLMEKVYPDPDYRKKAAEYMRKASTEWKEFRVQSKSGRTIDSEWSNIRLDDGTQIGIGIDITERKRAERELQRSSDLLRAIIEAAPTAIIGLDLDGNVQLVWNPAAEKMLGWSAQEAMGHLLPSVPVESQEEFRRFRERIRSGLTLDGVDVRRQRRDGRPIDYSIYASPLRDAEGQITGNIAVLVDITERKQAEEERERLLAQIQEQVHRVQEVVDTVPEGVLLLDSDCRVVLTNPLGQEDLATLAGAQVGDILTHLGSRPLAELLTSPPRGLWHEVATESRNLQVLARPVENDVTPTGWVLVIRDVTRQYESERRIQQQERLAAIGQLAAGIAHDFNNIMAVIVLHAQMAVRSEALSDRDRGRLVTINEQAHHATRLIQQILDFSRRAVLERQPLDLLPLLKEQVQLLERTLPEHIAIRLDYGHDKYTVNADPTRMQQMVMNLAVNARDAMPEGGALSIALERITIDLGAAPPLPELAAGDWIRLSIADTGVGVPPEVLPHIFEPFYTTKPPDRGSGLGLAQVYGIVIQHEGCIDVETRVGAGTTFTIYLPALEVHPTAPLSSDVSIVPQGKGEVVLVVEDNAPLRATLRETLAEWGYQVREAADGVQALALLEELGGVVDLVLSDVVMPETGGVALVHALRERGWVMPVILLSGYPQKRDMATLRAYGISAWLSKPPSVEELAEAVAQALGTD